MTRNTMVFLLLMLSGTLVAAPVADDERLPIDLRRTTLTNANFDGATLTDSDMREASLVGASLINADLSNSDLRDTDLSGSYLLGADLRGIHESAATDFLGAYYDAFTLFDTGFDTTGMIFVPEPRPAGLLFTGLVVLAAQRRAQRRRMERARTA